MLVYTIRPHLGYDRFGLVWFGLVCFALFWCHLVFYFYFLCFWFTSRDVKPENIMYISRDVNSGIKLTDFGLAMLHSGASITRKDDNLVGTPG